MFHSEIESAPGLLNTHADMGRTKRPETGDGYLGEIMVHRTSCAVGIVDNVLEARAGWPPEIMLKLKDGSFKKGRLKDFREPRGAERKQLFSS
jgi:hypothetical protein